MLDLTRVAERNGVIIQATHFGIDQLDGFSYCSEALARPFIWLNLDKGKYSRSRFDLAHELGHVVMHRRELRPDKDGALFDTMEREAHRFAGAFLMPRPAWLADIPQRGRDVTLAVFQALKPKWRTSIAAMIMRAEALKVIERDDAERLWKQYGTRKWRHHEPYDEAWATEVPTLVREATKAAIPSGRFGEVLNQHFPLAEAHLAEITGLRLQELQSTFVSDQLRPRPASSWN